MMVPIKASTNTTMRMGGHGQQHAPEGLPVLAPSTLAHSSISVGMVSEVALDGPDVHGHARR